MDRNAAPVTTALAMFVVILVTLAAGQIAVKLLNAPMTAKMTMLKIPAIKRPRPVVIMSASPAKWNRVLAERMPIVNISVNARSLDNSFLFIAPKPQPRLKRLLAS